jgi:hypothetical protein
MKTFFIVFWLFVNASYAEDFSSGLYSSQKLLKSLPTYNIPEYMITPWIYLPATALSTTYTQKLIQDGLPQQKLNQLSVQIFAVPSIRVNGLLDTNSVNTQWSK